MFGEIRDQNRFCTVSSAYLTDKKSKQVIAPHFFFISKLFLYLNYTKSENNYG